jgi:hypothetical protein
VIADFAIHKMTACYTSADKTTSAMRGTTSEYVGSVRLNDDANGSIFVDGDFDVNLLRDKRTAFFQITLEGAKLSFESFHTTL